MIAVVRNAKFLQLPSQRWISLTGFHPLPFNQLRSISSSVLPLVSGT